MNCAVARVGSEPAIPSAPDGDRIGNDVGPAPREMMMPITVTRRTALIGLSALVGLPARAQHSPTDSPTTDAAELAVLERPAIFEIISVSGSLKETRQAGQELIWRRITSPAERVLRISNLAVGLLAVPGKVTTTFSGNISSLGYTIPEEAQLHLVFRSKGGAVLHTSVVGIWVACIDNEQALHPLTNQIPDDIAGTVFANVGSVEITQHIGPGPRRLKVQRCS